MNDRTPPPTPLGLLDSSLTVERILAAGQRITDGSLSDHASKGTGPVYRIIQGRRYYSPTDVDAWIAANIGLPCRRAKDARRQSTSPRAPSANDSLPADESSRRAATVAA